MSNTTTLEFFPVVKEYRAQRTDWENLRYDIQATSLAANPGAFALEGCAILVREDIFIGSARSLIRKGCYLGEQDSYKSLRIQFFEEKKFWIPLEDPRVIFGYFTYSGYFLNKKMAKKLSDLVPNGHSASTLAEFRPELVNWQAHSDFSLVEKTSLTG